MRSLEFFRRLSVLTGAASLFAAGSLYAAAPNAVDDDLTGTPLAQNDTLEIDESELTANDSGSPAFDVSDVDATSTEGAELTWSQPQEEITYDPAAADSLLALDEGDDLEDTFDYTIENADGTDSATVTLLIEGVNDAPTLSDVPGSTIEIDDNETTEPFAAVTIEDPDADEELTVTVTIGAASEGSFESATDVTDLGGGEYEFTGTESEVTAIIRSLVFVPTENRLRPGDSDNTTLEVLVEDEALDDTDSVTIRVTSINDEPVIGGLSGANPSTGDDSSISPFSSITLTDPDHEEYLDVEITFDDELGEFTAASLSATGFTPAGGGTRIEYDAGSGDTVAGIQSKIRDLVFEPVENRAPVGDVDDADFTIEVTDRSDATDSANLTLEIESINDDPVLDLDGGPDEFNASGGETLFVFSSTLLTDADIDALAQSGDEGEGDEFTATLEIGGSGDVGSIASGSFNNVSGNTYESAGTRSELEFAIQQLGYVTPSENGTFKIDLTVEDTDGGVSNTLEISITVVQPDPGVTGLTEGQQLADTGTIRPFASVTFNSFGGSDRIVEVTLDDDAKGSFDILDAFTDESGSDGTIYRLTGSSVEATDAIRNLRFRPVPDRIVGDSETVTFTIRVKATGSEALLSEDLLDVTVVPVNDPPTISSDSPELRIDDDQTTQPFASMTLGDVDEGGTQNLRVRISLTGQDPDTGLPEAGGGTLSSGDDSIDPTDFSGTPDEVNAILQDLVFTPEPNRNQEGERETITFSVLVEDGEGGSAQSDGTSVIVLSVNGAPVISGIPPLSQQPFAVPGSADSEGTVTAAPFDGLTVTDDETPDGPDTLEFVITLDDADKGTLSDDDFTTADGGTTYTMSGTPSEITDALQALVYTLNPDHVFPNNQTGLTTFTFRATDSPPAENTTTTEFTIVIRERSLAHIVTSADDNAEGDPVVPGSLREAFANAGNNDFIVFDFPVDDHPVTIHLERPIEVARNITLVGSGVAELAVSGDTDGDGVGDVGLFEVAPDIEFTVERVTLRDGFAPSYGGAIAVDAGARVFARFASFIDNSAGQFGGAIDVFEGSLSVEHCYFEGNGVVGSTAEAGGAIFIYANGDSLIRNCTFLNNFQESGGGLGGGALCAEVADISGFLDVLVEHSTFQNNTDASDHGSAILSNKSGTTVRLRNSLLVDEQGGVVDVRGSGAIDSLGGNIATDDTITTYTQPGQPQNVTLLDDVSDLRSTDPLLLPVDLNGGITPTLALDPSSPAIGHGIDIVPAEDAPAVDQRGVWRDGEPDSGAFEADAFQRIQINEIYVNLAGSEDPFIEFYNPRDSAPLNLDGLTLRIDGDDVTTFGDRPLDPGAGFAWTSTVPLNVERGTIELIDADGRVRLGVTYVGNFAESGVELDTTGQSITRYPLYEGGFLPHQRVVERVTGVSGGALNSPDEDVNGALLDGGNAPPIAEDDPEGYEVSADATIELPVLANDIEFDRTDTLKVTEVMDLVAGSALSQELEDVDGIGQIALDDLPSDLDTTADPDGVDVSITDAGVLYDPRLSPVMIGLAKDETREDIYAYTIRDFDESDDPQSRGDTDTRRADNIVRATAYFALTVTGVNEAPDAADDAFATEENQAVRLLADDDLLAPTAFDFGDEDEDFMDFDSTGDPVVLTPASPTVAVLANDDDLDSDDDNGTIRLFAVHTSATPEETLTASSEKGASVVLDIRSDRRETNILYDPRASEELNALAEGEVTEDSFFYSVIDRHGAVSVAEVTVTVTGVNDVPTADDVEGYAVSEDDDLDIDADDLLDNDSDPDTNDTLSILQPVPDESTLGAVIDFDGTTINFDPRTIPGFEALARNETIVDTFTYTTEDGEGGTDTATVTVVVEGRNDTPTAADDLLEILENDISLIDPADGLLANDEDVDINGTPPDDDPWVLPQRSVTTPLGAALTIETDGSFRYNANSTAIDALYEGELAVETFPYTVIDNSRTTAVDDRFRIAGNRTDVDLPVLLNDWVVGTAPTAIEAYAEDDSDPEVVVIESADHALRDGLRVRIEDYDGAADYNGVHPVTVIDRDRFSIPLPFAGDPGADRGSWTPWFAITEADDDALQGTLEIVDGQRLHYTPAEDFYGEERFTYTIEDGVGGQDVAVVTLEFVLPPLNGFLSASDDRFIVGMGTEEVEVDVLANDNTLPAAGADLVIVDVQPEGGASGTVEIVGDSALRYTPPSAGFTGGESFRYTVSGGGTAEAEAIVSFDVVDRTEAVSGNPDRFFVTTGSADNLLDVLANDDYLATYPVTTSLRSIDMSAAAGTAEIVGDAVSYTPPDSPFLGTDAFTYTAVDASGATTTQTVQVRVVQETTGFYAEGDHYFVAVGADPVVLPVLSNDGTVLDDDATVEITNLGLDTDAPPDPSRVSIVNGGSAVEYTPAPDATTETFNYEIGIGTIDRREATVTVTVVDAYPTAPDARDDDFRVAKNADAQALDVLANDRPLPDAGWEWTLRSVDAPDQGGSAEIDEDGRILYTPDEGFFGVESFTYTIEDDFGATDSATVTIDVGVLLTADDRFAVLGDSLDNPLDVLANDDLLDVFAPDYTISAVGTPDQGGTVTIDGSGPANRLLYTPASGFYGEESFTYSVVDQTGGIRDATVTVEVLDPSADRAEASLRVEVTGINDLPVIDGVEDASITDKETVRPFADVTITDVDEAGVEAQTVTVAFDATYGTVSAPGMTALDSGTYQIVGTPAEVSAALDAIVFTPFENLIDYIDPGSAVVDFDLSTDDGFVAEPVEDRASVTVTPVNDAPTVASPIADRLLQVNSMPRAILLTPHFADVDDDVAAGELTWTVTGNSDASLFDSVSVDADKQLLVLDFAADAFGQSDLTVRATDRGGLFVETSFRVTVEGPPVIDLPEGQMQPSDPVQIPDTYDGSTTDFRQSFRVENEETLEAEAFIVHVSQRNAESVSFSVVGAEYSVDENGTPDDFSDDVKSSDPTTILRVADSTYAVKYDVPIPSGQSVVVHLRYRAASTFRGRPPPEPEIRIELTSAGSTGGGMLIEPVPDGADGEVRIVFNAEAGRSYELEYSSDMDVWLPWGDSFPVSEFDRTWEAYDDGLDTDPHPSLAPQRFYRVLDVTVP